MQGTSTTHLTAKPGTRQKVSTPSEMIGHVIAPEATARIKEIVESCTKIHPIQNAVFKEGAPYYGKQIGRPIGRTFVLVDKHIASERSKELQDVLPISLFLRDLRAEQMAIECKISIDQATRLMALGGFLRIWALAGPSALTPDYTTTIGISDPALRGKLFTNIRSNTSTISLLRRHWKKDALLRRDYAELGFVVY